MNPEEKDENSDVAKGEAILDACVSRSVDNVVGEGLVSDGIEVENGLDGDRDGERNKGEVDERNKGEVEKGLEIDQHGNAFVEGDKGVVGSGDKEAGEDEVELVAGKNETEGDGKVDPESTEKNETKANVIEKKEEKTGEKKEINPKSTETNETKAKGTEKKEKNSVSKENEPKAKGTEKKEVKTAEKKEVKNAEKKEKKSVSKKNESKANVYEKKEVKTAEKNEPKAKTSEPKAKGTEKKEPKSVSKKRDSIAKQSLDKKVENSQTSKNDQGNSVSASESKRTQNEQSKSKSTDVAKRTRKSNGKQQPKEPSPPNPPAKDTKQSEPNPKIRNMKSIKREKGKKDSPKAMKSDSPKPNKSDSPKPIKTESPKLVRKSKRGEPNIRRSKQSKDVEDKKKVSKSTDSNRSSSRISAQSTSQRSDGRPRNDKSSDKSVNKSIQRDPKNTAVKEPKSQKTNNTKPDPRRSRNQGQPKASQQNGKAQKNKQKMDANGKGHSKQNRSPNIPPENQEKVIDDSKLNSNARESQRVRESKQTNGKRQRNPKRHGKLNEHPSQEKIEKQNTPSEKESDQKSTVIIPDQQPSPKLSPKVFYRNSPSPKRYEDSPTTAVFHRETKADTEAALEAHAIAMKNFRERRRLEAERRKKREEHQHQRFQNLVTEKNKVIEESKKRFQQVEEERKKKLKERIIKKKLERQLDVKQHLKPSKKTVPLYVKMEQEYIEKFVIPEEKEKEEKLNAIKKANLKQRIKPFNEEYLKTKNTPTKYSPTHHESPSFYAGKSRQIVLEEMHQHKIAEQKAREELMEKLRKSKEFIMKVKKENRVKIDPESRKEIEERKKTFRRFPKLKIDVGEEDDSMISEKKAPRVDCHNDQYLQTLPADRRVSPKKASTHDQDQDEEPEYKKLGKKYLREVNAMNREKRKHSPHPHQYEDVNNLTEQAYALDKRATRKERYLDRDVSTELDLKHQENATKALIDAAKAKLKLLTILE